MLRYSDLNIISRRATTHTAIHITCRSHLHQLDMVRHCSEAIDFVSQDSLVETAKEQASSISNMIAQATKQKALQKHSFCALSVNLIFCCLVCWLCCISFGLHVVLSDNFFRGIRYCVVCCILIGDFSYLRITHNVQKVYLIFLCGQSYYVTHSSCQLQFIFMLWGRFCWLKIAWLGD